MDAKLLQTRATKLIVSRAPQIQPKRMALKEPGCCFRLKSELSWQFRTDDVTAWPDAGPGRRDEIGRTGSVTPLERAHRRGGRACRHASPAGMHRRDCAGAAIGQQERHAVGDAHCQTDRWVIADGDVRFGPLIVRSGLERGAGALDDTRPMHLAQAQQALRLQPNGRGDFLP